MARSTLPADTQEIACSVLRPPKITATRGLRGGVCSLIGVDPRAAAAGILDGMPSQPSGAGRPDPPALATLAVTAGRPAREPGAPLNPPVVLSSTYAAGAEIGYGRGGNPTWTAFEEALGALEDGTALAFASGM